MRSPIGPPALPSRRGTSFIARAILVAVVAPFARGTLLAAATLLSAALVPGAAAPAHAVSFYVTPNVPTTLPGGTYSPWEVARHDSGVYSLSLSLPSGSSIDALHREMSGDWLLSFAAPTILDGATYPPEDVLRYNGLFYQTFFDGSAAGVPSGSNVDALYLHSASNAIVLSFDTPTTIGGITYEPADLVRYAGTSFTFELDASSLPTPIPPSTNVTGAAQQGALIVLTFDVPTTLGATTYVPGELVAWDGLTFSSFHKDIAWPLSSVANAVALLPPPGATGTLMVAKSAVSPGALVLSWGAGCSAGAEDYGIYEGRIGDWYSHTAIDCTDDGGDLTEQIAPSPGLRYYLVVARNINLTVPDDREPHEGAYGQNSHGEPRPPGSPDACSENADPTPCP